MNVLHIPEDIWFHHIIPLIGAPSYIDFFWVCHQFEKMVLKVIKHLTLRDSVESGNTLVLSLFHKTNEDWKYILRAAASSNRAQLVRMALANIKGSCRTEIRNARLLKDSCSRGYLEVVKAICEKKTSDSLFSDLGFHVGRCKSIPVLEYLMGVAPEPEFTRNVERGAYRVLNSVMLGALGVKLPDSRRNLSPTPLYTLIREGDPDTLSFVIDALKATPALWQDVRRLMSRGTYNNAQYLHDLLSTVAPSDYPHFKEELVGTALLNGNLSLLKTLQPIDTVWISGYTIIHVSESVLANSTPRECLELAIENANLARLVNNGSSGLGVVSRRLFAAGDPIGRKILDTVVKGEKTRAVEKLAHSCIFGACKAGSWSSIEFVLRAMDDAGFAIGEGTIDAAYSTLCSHGHLHAIKHLERRMGRLPYPSLKERTAEAAGAGQIEIVKHFLQSVDKEELRLAVVISALASAVRDRKDHVIKYLRGLCEVPYAKMAVWSSQNKYANIETRRYIALSASETDRKSRNKYLRAVLLNSARIGNLILVEELLESFSISARTIERSFLEACASPDIDTIEALMTGRDLDVNKGLIAAALGRRAEAVRWLIQKGANNLEAALNAACHNLPNNGVVRELLKYGPYDMSKILGPVCIYRKGKCQTFDPSFRETKCSSCGKLWIDHDKHDYMTKPPPLSMFLSEDEKN